MRFVRWILIIALGGYALIAFTACAIQDRFVYFPDPTLAEIEDDWPIEEMRIGTPDGETLIAWVIAPAAGCPTFLLFHGNGDHLKYGTWQYMQIHQSGAGMLALAWRGYSGSTGRPSQDGLYTDAQAAYDALIAEGTDPRSIVVHGFSLGSGPATKLASENEVGALILEAPYYSALRLAEENAPFLPVSWIFRHKFRSDQFIRSVDEPTLIAHGSADSVIPAEHSAELAELSPNGVTRIVFEGSEHNTLVRDGLYEDAIWPFLAPIYPDCPFAPSDEVPMP